LLHAPGLQIGFKHVGDLKLWGDVSIGTFCPLVPLPHCRQVFNHLHRPAHPGLWATRRIISSRYVWRGLARDVMAWAQECLSCQRGKVYRHVRQFPVHVTVPERRFSHIHADLVGPLPAPEGATYVFTVIDRNTRWCEALPLSDISAKTCAAVLTQGWIARYGLPAVITSNRGSQFTSALWDSLFTTLGIRHVQTTAYHPQSNGLVEWFHLCLKDALRACLAGPMWTAHLPWVLLGLRATREEDNISAAQAVFGTPIVLPGQFLDENANVNENEFFEIFSQAVGAAEIIPTRHNVARAQQAPEDLPADLLRVEEVLVRRDDHVPPLEWLYNGPYRVLTRSRDFFRLQMGDRTDTVSTSRLKPCLDPAATPAAPPCPGLPPGQQRDVTFRWPPVARPLARLAVPGAVPRGLYK
jgi:transposase InsO family protein